MSLVFQYQLYTTFSFALKGIPLLLKLLYRVFKNCLKRVSFKEETEISKEITLEKDIFYCPICKQANMKSQKTFFCTHCGHQFPVDRNNQLILDENNF